MEMKDDSNETWTHICNNSLTSLFWVEAQLTLRAFLEEKLIWQRKLYQTFSGEIISASDVQRIAVLPLQFFRKDLQGKQCRLTGSAVGVEVADVSIIELPSWRCRADGRDWI